MDAIFEQRMIPPVDVEFAMEEGENDTLVCSGVLSTNRVFPRVGRIRYKFYPEAFSPEIVAEYMQKPILTWMHNREQIVTIGKTLSLEVIPDQAIKVRFVILPTSVGKDVIIGVKAKAIRSLSFSFDYDEDATDIESVDDGKGGEYVLVTIRKIARLNEVAVCDLGRNEDAVFDIAQDQRFSYPAFHAGKSKGVFTMELELKEQVNKVDTRLGQAETELAAVKKEVSAVAGLQAEVAKFRDSAERSQAENLEFVERITGDFNKAIDSMKEAQAAVLQSRIPSGSMDEICFSAKDATELPEESLKRALTPERFCQVQEFRRMNDQMMLVDLTLMAANPRSRFGQHLQKYQAMPFDDRIKTLKLYSRFEKASKAFAMDTTTSNEGSQYLPAAYSSQLLDMVRIDAVLAPMHETFRMTQTPQTKPVEGADIIATRATQTTTVVSSLNTTEQTPGSLNVTFAAEKLRTRVQYSAEALEDLIINEFDYVMKKSAIGQRRAVEKAMIEGDDAYGGTMDSGDAPGATDCRYCWDGYRVGIYTNHNASSSIRKVDLSAFSEENLNKVQTCLGKFAARSNQFFWLTSLKTYLMHFLNPTELPNHRTLDKMGLQATILTGQLSAYNAAPVLISEFVRDTYDEAGVYSAAGKNKSIVLCVNKDAYQMGQWRDIEAIVLRNALDDVYDLVTYQRCDFKMIYTIASDIVAAVGYNVNAS